GPLDVETIVGRAEVVAARGRPVGAAATRGGLDPAGVLQTRLDLGAGVDVGGEQTSHRMTRLGEAHSEAVEDLGIGPVGVVVVLVAVAEAVVVAVAGGAAGMSAEALGIGAGAVGGVTLIR